MLAYASNSYRQTRARTSAPSTLVVALHDEALSCLQQASDDAGASDSLIRAHAVIAELQLALDPTGAEELCKELGAVYDVMLQSITRAFVQREPADLSPVQEMLRELRGAWAELTAMT
jgi:flagellar biosynthetic protein FliS